METITEFLTPERSGAVLAALKGLFYASTLGFAAFVLATSLRLRGATARRRKLGLVPVLFAAALAAIIAYQATWQLAGFTRREFVRFMERHDPRHDKAAGRIVRGKIFDRKGRVLAESTREMSNFRVYPYAEAAAHIVGFRHPSEGLTGVENALDGILSGYLSDQKESIKEARRLALKKDRRVGDNVILTIDAELQRAAYELMKDKKGAVVGIDPRDGAIRLLVSTPSFDPNTYKRVLNIDPDSPLLNRALHGRYPAGSTFKTAIAGLAVDAGKAAPLDCPPAGYYAPGARRPIRDHEYYEYERKGLVWGGFGAPLDLDTALAKSSNTYFAHAGVLSGTDAFNELAERLKFNERLTLCATPFGAVTSQRGSLPKLGRGERRELSQLSIGQGRMLATPLHLALLTAAIANNGRMPAPRVVETDEPALLSQAFKPETAVRVKRAMRKVVTSGTARKADIAGLEIYAKTGTAQNPGGADHAWFICFATPKNAPPLALAVLVENAGFGSTAALPVAVEILRAHYGIGKE